MVDQSWLKDYSCCIFLFTVRSAVRRFRAGCTLNSYQPYDGTVTDDTQVLLALPFLSNPIIVNTLIFEIGDG